MLNHHFCFWNPTIFISHERRWFLSVARWRNRSQDRQSPWSSETWKLRFFFFVAAYRMDFIWFIDVYIKYIHTYIYIYNIWCILMNGFMRFDLVSYGLTIRFSWANIVDWYTKNQRFYPDALMGYIYIYISHQTYPNILRGCRTNGECHQCMATLLRKQ